MSDLQIKKGALLSYIAIVFSIIAGLIYTPWMIRQIGKSDYGLYILVTSFLTYFVLDFGLGQAIATFISKYKAKKEDYKIKQLLGLTTKIYLAIDILILVILFILYFLIEHIFFGLTSGEIEKLKVVYCIAGLFSLLSFPFAPLNGILISYERFVLLKFCDIIQKIGTIALMVLALLLGYKLYALVLVNGLVGIIIIFIKIYYVKRTTDVKLDIGYKDSILIKELFGFSGWVTLIGIAQRLLINIAPTLLAIFSNSTTIAVFAIGSVIEGYVWTFAKALNGLFLPKVANLSENNKDRTAVTNLMIKVGRIQLFIIGLLVVGIIVLGEDFIFLWMGEGFETSHSVALLLIIPGTIKITQEIANTLTFVENKIKYNAIIYLLSSLVSVCISLILIPQYGALGAAVGISIGILMVQIVGMNLFYQRNMGIDLVLFFKETFLKMGVPLILSLLFGYCLNYRFVDINATIFFIQAMALGVVYFLLMWFFGLNEFEKKLIKGILNSVILKIRIR